MSPLLRQAARTAKWLTAVALLTEVMYLLNLLGGN